MKITKNQKALIKSLLATADESELTARREDVSFTDAFFDSVTEEQVEFYFDRLMLTAHHLELNRQREAAKAEEVAKARINSIENYMTGLLGWTLTRLSDTDVSFTSSRAHATVKVVNQNIRMSLILNKDTMELKSILNNANYLQKIRREDLSEWDAGRAGHSQSELCLAFRLEIDSCME